ncbi:hypothetical protein SH2C18_45500 [Clostridium sediminicola]|uniref:hypothetical protein n=1 Tax=Clostridium sediminicola TaxID=3114879 RepID=UPI0031F28002
MGKFKFGTIKKDNEDIKYEYNDIWCLEEYPNFKRIVIAPKENQIDLMLEIAKSFESPLAILYVLVVSRMDTNTLGRYQCPFPLEYKDVDKLCNSFREFFETDGRHHLWICSANSKGIKQILVYDNHNVIYVYDDINKIKELLKRKGFKEEEVRFPVPHTHMYNSENDIFEKEILEYWEWIHFPLEEDD